MSKLSIGTDDRPLANLIRPHGKVLCFNYTEFVETIYQANDVCYIHGCRKRKGEKLILGHSPEAIGTPLVERPRQPRTYHQAVVDAAQESVLSLIAEYDKDLMKDCRSIIADHHEFFERLADIDQIIVVGHSFSPVDWDYFKQVHRTAPNVHWHFGSFGLRDLRNIRAFVKDVGLERFDIFRTDGIQTRPCPEPMGKAPTQPKARVFSSGDTQARISGLEMRVERKGRPCSK